MTVETDAQDVDRGSRYLDDLRALCDFLAAHPKLVNDDNWTRPHHYAYPNTTEECVELIQLLRAEGPDVEIDDSYLRWSCGRFDVSILVPNVEHRPPAPEYAPEIEVALWAQRKAE